MKLIWLCRNILLKSRLVKYINVLFFLKKKKKFLREMRLVWIHLSLEMELMRMILECLDICWQEWIYFRYLRSSYCCGMWAHHGLQSVPFLQAPERSEMRPLQRWQHFSDGSTALAMSEVSVTELNPGFAHISWWLWPQPKCLNLLPQHLSSF